MTHQQKDPSIRPKKPVWFYEHRDEAVGPVDEQALRRAAREGHLTPSTLVWRKSLDGWQPATAVPQVLAIIEQEAGTGATTSESPRLAPGPSVAQAQVAAPPASDPPPEALATSRPSPVPAAPSSPAEPAADLPSSAGSDPSGVNAVSVQLLADGSPGTRAADASAGKGRSRPPPKPHVPEVADDPGLGDAVSEEEELERPIREVDVRELLERTRSSHPARGRGSLPPSESGTVPPLHGSSVPAAAGSARAPALGRVDTGPAPAPARPLPLWAKVIGVAALFLLGMGAVLLTGRPRGAAETPGAAPAGRSVALDASTEPTKVDAARQPADSHIADHPASPAPARAVDPGEPGGAPAVVITEGPLPASVFQKQLDAAAPMFDEQCWQRLRAAEGQVAEHPSISIEIGVSAWGQIEQLVAAEAPPGYRGVGRCIVGRLRGWKFPRARARTAATLRIVPSTR